LVSILQWFEESTLLVAELIAPRQFHLSEQPIADPAPGEVQVRVGAVGICGSDLHSYAEGGIGDTPCVYPMVLGHEPAGTVVKAGPGVTGWSPGMRAALEPALYCYHCEFCLSGRHNLCANIRFLSNPLHPGFFREYINLPAHNLLPIPDSVPLDAATLIEPLAVAMHSMKFAGVQLGERAAVFGAGPIGLLTIACLKAAGAGRIWVVEPLAHRREMALAMGAHVVIDPNQVDAAKTIYTEAGNRGVDCAIDCATKEHTTNEAIRAAANGGRVVITGIHSACFVPFEVSPMRRKELAIFNVRRSNDEPERARDLLVEHLGWFAPMVTHRRPLADIAAAFVHAEHYEDGAGKTVIV
jgi:L-iditol 2-dehydrogenase